MDALRIASRTLVEDDAAVALAASLPGRTRAAEVGPARGKARGPETDGTVSRLAASRHACRSSRPPSQIGSWRSPRWTRSRPSARRRRRRSRQHGRRCSGHGRRPCGSSRRRARAGADRCSPGREADARRGRQAPAHVEAAGARLAELEPQVVQARACRCARGRAGDGPDARGTRRAAAPARIPPPARVPCAARRKRSRRARWRSREPPRGRVSLRSRLIDRRSVTPSTSGRCSRMALGATASRPRRSTLLAQS